MSNIKAFACNTGDRRIIIIIIPFLKKDSSMGLYVGL